LESFPEVRRFILNTSKRKWQQVLTSQHEACHRWALSYN